jgi:hypothetical protein
MCKDTLAQKAPQTYGVHQGHALTLAFSTTGARQLGIDGGGLGWSAEQSLPCCIGGIDGSRCVDTQEAVVAAVDSGSLVLLPTRGPV